VKEKRDVVGLTIFIAYLAVGVIAGLLDQMTAPIQRWLKLDEWR